MPGGIASKIRRFTLHGVAQAKAEQMATGLATSLGEGNFMGLIFHFPASFQAIYVHSPDQPAPLEWQIFKLGFFASLTAGFVFGGLLTVPESSRRFEVYAAGKDFGQIGFQQVNLFIDYFFKNFLRQIF